MMQGDDNTVQVNIYGKTYTVKGKADTSYISNVASYVDTKMRDVEQGTQSVQSDVRVAILAAMNVTDELFGAKRDQERLENHIEERIGALTELIDEALST